MKKWLVGCLITGLLLLVVGGGLAYWFIWRPLSAAGGEFMGQVDDLKKIGEADQAVKNKSSFTAPVDGILSGAQINAFVTIQQTISDKMGPDFALLEEKYKKANETSESKADPNLKDVMGAYADMTKLIGRAKQAQVEALNVQNMSLEEYRWIRTQVSSALPFIAMDPPKPVAAVSTDSATPMEESTEVDTATNDAMAQAKEATDAAMKQVQEMQDAMPDGAAAKANAELLRPHKELLFKTMTAAWLSM
ncbi:MAG: hypothetical protein ABI644_05955 [Arenimonas sp.]